MALAPDKTRNENRVRIHEKIIPDSARAVKDCASWCKKGQPMKPCRKLTRGVQGVTIHNTADLPGVSDDAEQYTRATWPNCNMGGVVVHYYVDDLGAWQNLREDEAGWHASDGSGTGNTGTIAIEVIMTGKNLPEDQAAEDNAARLAASILHRYGLAINDLYTHNHWMGRPDKIVANASKNCPVYILPQWEAFKGKTAAYLKQLTGGATSVDVPIKSGDRVKVNKAVTYTGTPFAMYYSVYEVISVKGDRAVIGINSIVTAAVNVENLTKA